MTPEYAAELVRNVTYKPGWRIRHESIQRYGNELIFDISFPAPDSSIEYAPAYEVMAMMRRTLAIGRLDEIETENEFYRLVFDQIMMIELHEAREFFRLSTNWQAPFHPHRAPGSENWRNTLMVTIQKGTAWQPA